MSASAGIQWKGTDVCLDFYCICGFVGHFDGFFAYGLHCARCGQEWEMPTTLQLEPGSPENELVQGTNRPHSPNALAADNAPRLAEFSEERP